MNWIVFLCVLAEIESGNGFKNNDKVVTKYQITQSAVDQYNQWFNTSVTLSFLTSNPELLDAWVMRYLSECGRRFELKNARKPSPFYYALFWRDGYPINNKRKIHTDYALRLSNLYTAEILNREKGVR